MIDTRELTPSQRLWAEIFGLEGIPKLKEEKVLSLISSLPSREALAIRLRFGFQRRPLTFKKLGKKLPRTREVRVGVSKQMAMLILAKALRYLRHPSRRRAWEEARLS